MTWASLQMRVAMNMKSTCLVLYQYVWCCWLLLFFSLSTRCDPCTRVRPQLDMGTLVLLRLSSSEIMRIFPTHPTCCFATGWQQCGRMWILPPLLSEHSRGRIPNLLHTTSSQRSQQRRDSKPPPIQQRWDTRSLSSAQWAQHVHTPACLQKPRLQLSPPDRVWVGLNSEVSFVVCYSLVNCRGLWCPGTDASAVSWAQLDAHPLYLPSFLCK